MAKPLSPKSIDPLIKQDLTIEDDNAREAGALGFMGSPQD